MGINFSNPIFLRAVNEAKTVPLDRQIVVFAGRSNVGKSSVINLLCGGRFTRVSRTPGRTRLINLFELGDVLLADLPGYGYAAVAKTQQQWWGKELAKFMLCPAIACVVVIVDSRRGIGQLDQQLLDLCASRGLTTLVVFNKIDKLNNQQKAQLRRQYGKSPYTTLPCSVLKKIGEADIKQYLLAVLSQ